MRDLVIAIAGIVIALIVWSGWQAYQHTHGGVPSGPTACTMEAKLCPDGSYVARSGPRCEFAACPEPVEGRASNFKDVTFTIDGAPTRLSSTGIKYFGNDATGDLNGDGQPDTAFLLTYDGGGSGTFYYVVVALTTADGGYIGTNAILLGDRIAPQTTEIKDGELIVNYADRKPSEPMSAPPSVGVSKYLKISNDALVEVSVSAGQGITGTVMLGPTCPVERIPPDPACADKGYATKFDVTSVNGAKVVKEFSSNPDGTFSVGVPAGDYAIRPVAGTSMLPRCSSVDSVVVAANAYSVVSISCDTGIR
jgi:hypothetical protein